jgi:8-oxo-dGTP pyrophosphatase MutT (NUDIX family)
MDETVNPWTVLAEQTVYDNPWIRVTAYDVLNPSGGKGIYGKVHFKNLAIGVIPIDEDWNTWLVGQYRFVLNAYSWEMPEGGGPLGIDPLESAQRELLEETGLVAEEWTEIQRLHLSNSVSDELSILYLARNFTQQAPAPEETEQLVVRKVPFDEVCRMVEEGKITDAMTVTAVLKIQLMRLHGQIS